MLALVRAQAYANKRGLSYGLSTFRRLERERIAGAHHDCLVFHLLNCSFDPATDFVYASAGVFNQSDPKA